MQLSNSVSFSIAALLAVAKAENLIVALVNDVDSNVLEYQSYAATATNSEITSFYRLYLAAQTYTDDSYTTLLDSAELAEISSFVTQLPWYSSRLESNIDGAVTTTNEASSSAPASSAAVASSAAASSAVSSTSAAASTSAVASSSAARSGDVSSAISSTSGAHSHTSSAGVSESSGVSSASDESSADSSSSSAASTSTSKAAADLAAVVPGAGLALALGAIALL